MSSSSHVLLKIPESEWIELRNCYAHLKLSSSGYYTIDNSISLKNKGVNNINFYALDGDWRSDGTFLIIIDELIEVEVYFNTLDATFKRLKLAFSCLDGKEQLLFCAYSKQLSPPVEHYIATRGLKKDRIRYCHTYWQHGTKTLIDTFDIKPPSGITLKSLEIQHAKQINEIWPYRSPDSEAYVRYLIKNDISLGAFDQQNQLVAWVLRYPNGTIGLLQVIESHKRLGLGTLLTRAIVKQISALNEDVFAAVAITNTPSLKMFEKLEFKITDEVFWATVPAIE